MTTRNYKDHIPAAGRLQKSPMYFIAIACDASIGLDYLFMGAFRIGPAGAALGTTLSQAISVIVSLAVIWL